MDQTISEKQLSHLDKQTNEYCQLLQTTQAPQTFANLCSLSDFSQRILQENGILDPELWKNFEKKDQAEKNSILKCILTHIFWYKRFSYAMRAVKKGADPNTTYADDETLLDDLYEIKDTKPKKATHLALIVLKYGADPKKTRSFKVYKQLAHCLKKEESDFLKWLTKIQEQSDQKKNK